MENPSLHQSNGLRKCGAESRIDNWMIQLFIWIQPTSYKNEFLFENQNIVLPRVFKILGCAHVEFRSLFYNKNSQIIGTLQCTPKIIWILITKRRVFGIQELFKVTLKYTFSTCTQLIFYECLREFTVWLTFYCNLITNGRQELYREQNPP